MEVEFLGLSSKLENYGCAGIGRLDAFEKTAGIPLDDVDRALNERKHCIRCARNAFQKQQYGHYDYVPDFRLCGE